MRFAALAILLFAGPTFAQPKLPNLPPDLMAPTDPLSPADERKAFTVPAGFDVQLVASEPQIQKPMQMAFDAKGRMWVTTSYHYPFAATDGKPSDKVFVLSDFDPATGKAGKVQVFTSDLNIPIGILPMPDCKSVIVSSVGEIRKYKIAEAGGVLKSDGYEVLFKGFGSRDTHGMYNSYTLMPDGWVYSCHGFANDSTVKGKDGHEVKMQSGHTFRFRPDGSRIEVYSRGQVNPFGMTVDPWFNLYTADCHSKPITQIIPGAYYDSFGKPHDGLGFAPHVTAHPHKSTGLCGLVWYDAEQFPKEYKSTMLIGDVVSNCISFDKIEWKGASPVAKEMPDFLTSKDRWFRPVDIKLGPDGALYVADFYNKIIGHYEVSLTDPRRDKDRGRIWRIVWKGTDGKAPVAKAHRADFTKATDSELLSDLSNPNLMVRFQAGNQLRQRAVDGKTPDFSDLPRVLTDPDKIDAVSAWCHFIQQAGKDAMPVSKYETLLNVEKALRLKPEQLTGHVIRALNSRPNWDKGERTVLLDAFKSLDSIHVKRAALEAVIFHPHADFVAPVIEVLKKCAPDDTHLRQAAKIALRNCLRDADAWPKDYDAVYADMAFAIPNQSAAKYLSAQVIASRKPAEKLAAAAEHASRYGSGGIRDQVFTDLTDPSVGPLPTDALLGAFRGLSAAGEKLLDRNQARVLKYAEAEFVLPPSDEAPIPDADVRHMVAAARVLIALPTVSPAPAKIALRKETVTTLSGLVTRSHTPIDLRLAAADVLLRLASDQGLLASRSLLAAPDTTPDLRERLLVVFASSNVKDARLDARDAIKDAPYRTAVAVGVALAGTPAGADDLLTAVKTGKAPARLLQEKVILERLKAANVADLDKQVAALTKGLPALDARLAELIKKRATAFASAKPDKELGAKLFTKHCAACHRIGDVGGKIAPQLDGIGVRGVERILEDTLDPNRNVDQAFRARIITTKDEKTITGLMLRVEGEVLIVADGEGKEQRIPTKDIATNRETMLSPMPANVGDTIPEADFMHLVAYLLDQKREVPKKE